VSQIEELSELTGINFSEMPSKDFATLVQLGLLFQEMQTHRSFQVFFQTNFDLIMDEENKMIMGLREVRQSEVQKRMQELIEADIAAQQDKIIV
jgi:hypothetical protein